MEAQKLTALYRLRATTTAAHRRGEKSAPNLRSVNDVQIEMSITKQGQVKMGGVDQKGSPSKSFDPKSNPFEGKHTRGIYDAV